MHRIIVASLSLLVAGVPAGAAAAADARKGETLAKRWCATCHIVSIDQQRGTTQSPPFSAIASRPEFDEAKLAFFLLTPHPRMPDMNLSRSEAADLAAYIKTQK
jgi:mono/diheme cytochrome c family protein